jgi:DNA invertase Pin-like site-specific DNA recombinase
MFFVRAYLRASTDDQDAQRAREQVETFAHDRGLSIAAWYVENESGAKLARPELFRLLKDCKPGDVLLVEQVDRLSRLTASDWEKLKTELSSRHVRVVALDLPTSWMMATSHKDEFTGRMFDAINGMLLDMLAAVARKDYEDRRRRQSQGRRARRLRGSIRAGRKTYSAIWALPPCWPPARLGTASKRRRDAVAQPSQRSPKGTCRPANDRFKSSLCVGRLSDHQPVALSSPHVGSMRVWSTALSPFWPLARSLG